MEKEKIRRKESGKMTRRTYQIGIGVALILILVVSAYWLYQEKQKEQEHEDGVLVKIEKNLPMEEEIFEEETDEDWKKELAG